MPPIPQKRLQTLISTSGGTKSNGHVQRKIIFSVDFDNTAPIIFIRADVFKICISIKVIAERFSVARMVTNNVAVIHNDDITAVSLAAQIGYSREYVSRLFNKYMKESIPSYINKTRAQYVEEQKRISDKRLTELILAAGFKYTSSYYRFINNQKELTKNGTLSESITSR